MVPVLKALYDSLFWIIFSHLSYSNLLDCAQCLLPWKGNWGSIAEWETFVIKISAVKGCKISCALWWGSTMCKVALFSLVVLEEKKALGSVLGTLLHNHCYVWGNTAKIYVNKCTDKGTWSSLNKEEILYNCYLPESTWQHNPAHWVELFTDCWTILRARELHKLFKFAFKYAFQVPLQIDSWMSR